MLMFCQLEQSPFHVHTHLTYTGTNLMFLFLLQKVYQFGHKTISVSTNVNRNYVLVQLVASKFFLLSTKLLIFYTTETILWVYII